MASNSGQPKIAKVEIKCRAKETLSAADLAIAERTLDSSNFSEKVIACEALLRYSGSVVAKGRALRELENLCRQALEDLSLMGATLIYSLRFVPEPDFANNKTFREITFQSARGVNLAARTNSMFLLEQRAQLNDVEALELLEASLHDSHEYVRHNARLALDRLARGIKLEP